MDQPIQMQTRRFLVEAMRWPATGGEDDAQPILDWIHHNGGMAAWHPAIEGFRDYRGEGVDAFPESIRIVTPVGFMAALPGWWILLDGNDIFTPFDPEFVEEEYELVPTEPEDIPENQRNHEQ